MDFYFIEFKLGIEAVDVNYAKLLIIIYYSELLKKNYRF
jgi:hypothetical protein